MLIVHASDEVIQNRLRSVLEPGYEFQLAKEWGRFVEQVPGADCGIVAVPSVRSERVVGRLAELKFRYPGTPVVLVTRRSPENVRRASRVRIEKILWLDRMEQDLEAAISRALGQSLLRRLADEMSQELDAPGTMRRALAFACLAAEPVTSVQELARSVGCDRRTLWSQWRATVDSTSELQLKEFLGWLLLLRATARKRPGLSWDSVASSLGVDRRTLARTAKRLTGESLSKLGGLGTRPLVTRLQDELDSAHLDVDLSALA